MTRLHLFRSEAALEAALDELIRHKPPGIVGVELGRGLTSIPRLLAEAGRLGEIGTASELLARHLAAEQVGRLDPLPSSLRPALGRALSALRRAGVPPASLRQVAPQLPDGARVDALQLADRLERYERVLGAHLDRGVAQHVALSALAREALPSLAEVNIVELHASAPFDVPTRLTIDALAARGLTVRCGIGDPVRTPSTRWDAGVLEATTRALDLLEADGGANVERVPVALPQGPTPRLVLAPGPLLEARYIARVLVDRLATTPPDELVVAAPDEGLRERVRRALVEYGVPVAERADRRADETAVFRLVRSIYALASDGLARDPFARLLASPLLAPAANGQARIAPGRLASLVRQALPETHDASAWEGPLFAYARHDETRSLVRHVLGIRDRLRALPERGPLSRHLDALGELLDALGLPARARRLGDGPVPVPRDETGAARAEEQAALRILDRLRAELPAAARRLELAERSWSRREVESLLLSAWAEPPLHAVGARGGVVTVCAYDAIPEGRLAVLVLAGASEGSLRGPSSDPLLHDETLNTLGRALGRPLLDTATDPARRERLVVARALGRATNVWVTRSRTDEGGRALLPGELVEHALALGATQDEAGDARLPGIEEARTRAEVAARFLVEVHGDATLREGLDEATLEMLREQLGARLPRVEALVSMEHERARFFASTDPGGPYDGRIFDEQVRARLVESALPGRAERPLSASTLSRYVECPQRFWLDSVLRVAPPDEATDELDERQGGRLVHVALEALFARWRDAGLLPLRGHEAEAEHLDEALGQVVARWRKDRPVGNEILFEQRVRALARLLRAVWQHEIERASPLLPTHLEHAFDKVEVPGGSPPLFVGGSIDRVDRGVGRDATRAAVVDYKSGAIGKLKKELKEEAFGETSWQLPLYAAVVRAELGVEEVALVYYSLKEMKIERADAPAWLRLDGGEFVDRLWAQVRRMREGHFEVRPKQDACKGCRLQPACRIVERRGENGEDAT
ncbi:MAG: PD-(D/E)XK nuclease family protein [Polyangia bacterium]